MAEGAREGRYLIVPKMLYDSAQVGMAGALRHDRLNCDALDFTAALAIALADPDIDSKWFKGWPVFRPARLRTEGRTEYSKTRPAARL